MLYNTLSTLGMSRRLQTTLTQLQMDMVRANEEIATGVHADVSATIGARTGRDIALRNMFDRTEEYLKTTALLDGRMGTMDSAMTSILTAGTDLLATASTGLGQQAPTGVSLQNKAKATLDQIVGMLNAASGNAYLFAGTAVEAPPMRAVDGDKSGLPSPMQIVRDAITAATGGSAMPTTAAQTAAVIATLDDLFAVRDPATAAPAPLTDTFEGGFYTGTTAMQAGGGASPRITGRPADATSVPYGVQANDPMFRDLLQGAYMLAAVDTSTMEPAAYKDYIEEAVSKMSKGLGDLRQATALLGIQRNQIASVAEQHQTQKTILNLQIDNLEGVDYGEASTRISNLEAQIDATASATARIAKMHLTNYL
ncbi:flagellin [Azospirillum agricola]|uniref:flagellin n=1 Tax=Azospirillum agricola TaxID=1720247 RepID=UPI000A0EF54D|nr:flagellin [Azospirillum agricola]SMH63058.1 flagellar hook-associated protein 3 FlgL [Azospirillum lipoferum]